MARSDEKGAAVGKRLKIKNTKQSMLLIVLIAALSIGICVVLGIRWIKFISFYSGVIEKKDAAIVDYEKTIANIGLCPKSSSGHYSIDDLKKCNPNSYSAPAGTLRYEITNVLANNEDLESVARENDVAFCYDDDGDRIDYQTLLDSVSQDEAMYAHYLGMLKICSSLRVIPDALPASKNVEALLASLNQIFVISDWDPESLSPSGNGTTTAGQNIGSIPVSLSVESTTQATMNVLRNIEKSIRVFDISTASIEWAGSDKITLQAQANAYYATEAGIAETKVVQYANKNKKKSS